MEADYVVSALPADADAPADMLALLGTLFEGLTLEQWRWEYRRSPGGATVFQARGGDRLLGHYAVIGVPFRLGTLRLNGEKAEGSLVDRAAIDALPPTADRRVFLRLVRAALQGTAERGVDVVFGFPNTKALPTQSKGGYAVLDVPLINARCIRHLGRYFSGHGKARWLGVLAPLWDRVVDVWLARRASDAPGLRPLTMADAPQLERFNDRFGAANPDSVFIELTWDYIKWRFLDNPHAANKVLGAFDADGTLVGVIAASTEGDGRRLIVHIQHVAALDGAAMDRLLRWAVGFARESDAAAIDVWTQDAPSHAVLNQRLGANGFWLRRKGASKKMIVFSPRTDLPLESGRWLVSRAFSRY